MEIGDIPNMSGIYCYENLLNGKKYIGQAVNLSVRIKRHERYLKRKEYNSNENIKLWRAVQKYGRNNFIFYIIELCKIERLNILEENYIRNERTTNDEYGYNILYGGNLRNRGLKFSQEHRHKLSISKVGDKNPNFGNKKEKCVLYKRKMEYHPAFGKKHKNAGSKYYGVQKIHKNSKIYYIARITEYYIGQFNDEIFAAKKYDEYVIANKSKRPLNFSNKIKGE